MNIKDSLKQVKEIEKETVERKAFKITEGNHYVNEDHAVKEFKQIADSGTIEELKSLTDALNELKNFISSSENLKIIEVSHLIKNLIDAIAWLGEKYNEFEDYLDLVKSLEECRCEEDIERVMYGQGTDYIDEMEVHKMWMDIMFPRPEKSPHMN